MKATNIVKITFPAKSINEAFARGAISSFIATLDPTVEQLADIKTAVSEAVTNAIVHAYPNTEGVVRVSAATYERGDIVISIADKGVGITDVSKAMQPLYTTGGDERAGLGFAVMESFMDKVRVRSIAGKGTKVVLYKNLKG